MTIFRHHGEECTGAVIEIATARAKELGIEKIVLASCSGATALRFMKSWPAERLIVVRHVTGFDEPSVQEMPAGAEKQLLSEGARIVTSAHALGGIGRAVRRKLGTYEVDEIIAHALRIFGQGTKVAVEIALQACDAGYVRTDEKIISCGGSARGIDTALLLTPANTHNFFDLVVHEILCKPGLMNKPAA